MMIGLISVKVGLSLDQIGKCLVLGGEEINQRLIQIVDKKYFESRYCNSSSVRAEFSSQRVELIR
jgi:hypothetical protein